jgi:thiol-disulfide isomerase/thioredoxin
MPEQKDRIRTLARTMYRTASAKDKGRVAGQMASTLFSSNVLLKDAEGYAQKSVDSMNLAAYLTEQIGMAEKAKRKPPSSDELAKRFRESRATRVATLGQIEVKLGKTAKGRKLLEEAYAVNSDNPAVAGVLGELAAKAGNDSKAAEYLIPALLSGRATKTSRDAFETIYKKTHSGSTAGLDAMLDGEYRKRFPSPLQVDAYKPTDRRSDRQVLAEVFTGSGCPPCVAADLAFDAAMNRYSRKDLAVVMYHEHIPRPDPMTNPDTQARWKVFAGTGVPTFAIDGKTTVGGGGRANTKSVFDRFKTDLEKDLEAPAEAKLTANAALNGNAVKVAASVDAIKSESKDLKLQVALVEKELRYTGENGVRFHPMVVRAMGGDKGAGFPVEARGRPASFDQAFDLDAVSAAIKAHLDDYEAKGHRGESFTFLEKKYQINRADLAVVVFVQDDKTKHVLQSVYVDLALESGTRPVTEAAELRK